MPRSPTAPPCASSPECCCSICSIKYVITMLQDVQDFEDPYCEETQHSLRRRGQAQAGPAFADSIVAESQELRQVFAIA